MNKKIALFAITLLFPLAAIAQRGGDRDYEEPDKDIEGQVNSGSKYNGREFHYGAKIGFNLTSVTTDRGDIQAKIGQLGFLCRWQWENWAVQPELFYSKLGVRSLEREIQYHPDEKWRMEGQDIVGHTDLMNEKDFKLGFYTHAIMLPVMFKYYLPVFDKGFNVQAGPMISYDIDYSYSTPVQKGYLKGPYFGMRFNDRSNTITGLESLRYLGRTRNKFQTYYQVGIGYDSNSGIGVDIRYAQAFTKVFDNLYDSDAKYLAWAVSFSYVF